MNIIWTIKIIILQYDQIYFGLLTMVTFQNGDNFPDNNDHHHRHQANNGKNQCLFQECPF